MGWGRAEPCRPRQRCCACPGPGFPVSSSPLSPCLPPLLSWENPRAEQGGALYFSTIRTQGGGRVQATFLNYLPRLPTREVSVRQVYQGTGSIWIQMTLPERLLLRALRVLAPNSQQWTQQAVGIHLRTREGVWGSPFPGPNRRECCSLGVSLA